MNVKSGRSVGGLDHLYQSIAKILTTPRGSRLERREFGSDLPSLIDSPNNGATRVRLYAATAGALMRWEPRLKLTRVRLADETTAQGTQVLDIEGVTVNSGELVNTSVPLTAGSAA